MRILIDIGHPAHYHYFKHFSKLIKKKGFEIFFTARKRKYIPELLSETDFNYYFRSDSGNTIFKKLLKIIWIDYQIYKIAKNINPDLFLSSKSIYSAHVSWLLKKPYIAISDTEVSKYEDLLSIPFIDTIITPNTFQKNFKNKHIMINSVLELAYTHPKYFCNLNSEEIYKIITDVSGTQLFGIYEIIQYEII